MTSESGKDVAALNAAHSPLSAEQEFLLLRRHYLVTAYAVILVGWILLIVRIGFYAIPDMLGGGSSSSDFKWEVQFWPNLLFIIIFFVLQVLFLWGGGKIQLAMKPTRLRKVLFSVTLFAALMSLLSAGLLLSFGEMTARLEGDPFRGGSLYHLFDHFWLVLTGGWIFWLLIGYLSVKGVGQYTALSRLVTTMLAGSWIEFAVALPLELASRPRHEDCPCESGSWFALLICAPILLWTVGPAIYLLYLRARRLAAADPRYSRRVLLRKSERQPETVRETA